MDILSDIQNVILDKRIENIKDMGYFHDPFFLRNLEHLHTLFFYLNLEHKLWERTANCIMAVDPEGCRLWCDWQQVW